MKDAISVCFFKFLFPFQTHGMYVTVVMQTYTASVIRIASVTRAILEMVLRSVQVNFWCIITHSVIY